jgi:hypothetical protein
MMTPEETERISSLLKLVAESLDARRNPEDPAVALALMELGKLARLQIPARGVLPLSDDRLFDAIDSVAVKHLNLAVAREELNVALSRVDTLSSRNEIEVAVDHICAVLNIAYFNAGLAFGITLADLKSL